jgi:hypothetical protein
MEHAILIKDCFDSQDSDDTVVECEVCSSVHWEYLGGLFGIKPYFIHLDCFV